MNNIGKASSSGISEAQATENRAFDKQIAVHGEKISTLETASSDMETRLRNLEKFKYMTTGIGFILGIVLSAIVQFVFRKWL